MIRILSWNIQNGKGVDGRVSLDRIATVIRDMGPADVICLQEVSRGLDLGTDAGAPDQVEALAHRFPEYEVAFGAGVDTRDPSGGPRWQFGNLLLSRQPLLSVFHHVLPRPAEGGRRHMTRAATEVVVTLGRGTLRIVNLHLEFHSERQRIAQIERLRAMQAEAIDESLDPPATVLSGPYAQERRPREAIYCGDFNMDVDSAAYSRFLDPIGDDPQPFSDAWRAVFPDRSHAPTCGIHDRDQWPQGPHCRDFFFVAGLASNDMRAVHVNTETDASDHQPLVLELSRE